jgi:ATP-dependent Clp protease ATP-binding subunit ClpA
MGPFDRFNDRSKRVFALAQDEAIRFNHNYIGAEHLVLGLTREGEGVAARALASLGIELSRARTAVEFIVGRGDATSSPSEITLSPQTKKIIGLAIEEARKLGNGDVATEHLLIGIVRDGEGAGADVIMSFGVSLDQVRHQVIATMGQQPPGTTRQTAAAATHFIAATNSSMPLDRLDGTSRRALARAYWEAGRANAEEVMPHHLLLALVANEEVWIRQVLTQIGVDFADLVARIDGAAPPRPGPRPAGTTESRALVDVIGRAASLAAEGNRALIRNEHLLLAIAADDGIGATVLTSVGATPQRIRELLERMNG